MAQRCILVLFFVFFFLILLSAADEMENCPKFHCRKYRELHFPFTNINNKPECGLYIRGCDDLKPEAAPQVQMGNGEWYNITWIDQREEKNSFSIKEPKLEQLLHRQNCTALDDYDYPPPPPSFPVFSPMMSESTPVMSSLNLFRCNNNVFAWDNEFLPYLNCNDNRPRFYYGFVPLDKEDQFKSCRSVRLSVGSEPKINPNFNPYDIRGFLTDEITFTVILFPDCHKCYYERGGQCRQLGENFECVLASATEKKGSKAMIIVFGSYLELRMLDWVVLYINGKLRENPSTFMLKPKPISASKSLKF